MSPPHQQYAALKAIRDHLNHRRADNIENNIKTVLPHVEINDAADEDKAFSSNNNPEILTHLSIGPDETTAQNFVGFSGAEVNLPVFMDWILIVPRQHFEFRNSVYYAGLREIEDVLLGLQSSGLTDPETGARMSAGFRLDRAVPSQSDIGSHIIMSCQIVITLTLFARSVLS